MGCAHRARPEGVQRHLCLVCGKRIWPGPAWGEGGGGLRGTGRLRASVLPPARGLPAVRVALRNTFLSRRESPYKGVSLYKGDLM